MAVFKSSFGPVDVVIPEGCYDIPDECIVKDGDKVANVTFGQNSKEHKLTWLEVDATEVGKVKKYSGQIVIRKI